MSLFSVKNKIIDVNEKVLDYFKMSGYEWNDLSVSETNTFFINIKKQLT